MSGTPVDSDPAVEQPQFLGCENPSPRPERSLFHVIPAPLERSVSYGRGTGNGPSAILSASEQLEVFDGVDVPLEHGIYTWPAVSTDGDIETVFSGIERACRRAFSYSAVPVLFGGEHAVTLPAVCAALRCSEGAGRLGIVQLDAHGDLRDSYHGDRYSHATVMRRCHDLGVPIHAIGVRALSPEDITLRRQHPGSLTWQDAAEIVPAGGVEVCLPDGFPEDVYLTIDVDGLDPSVISATGTPEPGGLPWYQALALVSSLAARRRVIAFDVVELAPVAGRIADDFAAARLTYQVMGIVGRSRVDRRYRGAMQAE